MNENNYLAHHGILGQKWGVRRFQNPDGTLTDVGRKRYSKQLVDYNKTAKKVYDKVEKARWHSATKKRLSNKLHKINKKQFELRMKIVNSSKECRDILDEAQRLDRELDKEYKRWSNDEVQVKRAFAKVKKDRGYKESVDELIRNAGIDGWANAWGEHKRLNPTFSKKEDRIINLQRDYQKAARKVLDSVLEAYGDVSAKAAFEWTGGERDALLDYLSTKAGYDDYYTMIFDRNPY